MFNVKIGVYDYLSIFVVIFYAPDGLAEDEKLLLEFMWVDVIANEYHFSIFRVLYLSDNCAIMVGML